jgi:hypothetical protein
MFMEGAIYMTIVIMFKTMFFFECLEKSISHTNKKDLRNNLKK